MSTEEQETWVPVPLPEFAPAYEVSNLARVRRTPGTDRLHSKDTLKPNVCRNRLMVKLQYEYRVRGIFISHLVCSAFVAPRPSPDHWIAHKDGDYSNCMPDNLFWRTRAEANRARIASNALLRVPRPARQSTRGRPPKLSPEQTAAVLALKGVKYAGEVAVEFHVSRQTIYTIWGPIYKTQRALSKENKT